MTKTDGGMGNHDMAGATLGKRAGRFLGIVTLFALPGPPMGGMAVSAYLGFLAAASHLADHGWTDATEVFLTATLFSTVFGFSLAYIIGIVPAVGVGLAVAIWDMRKGLISWRVAIGAALVWWLLIAVRAGEIMEADEGTRKWQISMLLAHLVATGVCWWTARTIFGPRRSHTLEGSG